MNAPQDFPHGRGSAAAAAAAGGAPAIEFDAALIARYDQSGPRYTSYPTADRFTPDFDADAYAAQLRARTARDPGPLSLYVHLPFCSTVCFYCACNKIVTGDRAKAARYLPFLAREIALQAAHCGAAREIRQLHWGGGTPTFYSDAELAAVMTGLREHFIFAPDGEYSIEVDPRGLSAARVAHLGALGFNRMSLGVQDFDPRVQRAVNRVQSVEETRAVLEAARACGFRSLSVDLIYGLPHQHIRSFARTLDEIIAAAPDRVSVYNYAHLPHLFKPQQRITADDLPSAGEKLEILHETITRLTGAGYVYIGMDHFARAGDELVRARDAGSLHRNFQGYSTHADLDMLALGVTAIGRIGPTYSQNQRDTDGYYAALADDRLPIFRGYACDADDLLRREIIQTLMCGYALDFRALGARHGIDPRQYFAAEFADLDLLAADGLVTWRDDVLCATPRGRLLLRAIGMIFDRHLRADRARRAYSRVI
ncbi:MAG: oxygen-independent coproporphyrinogen III oxidase [Gammaproteobacteria bacterium]